MRWIVKLVNGKHELATHLERKSADACLDEASLHLSRGSNIAEVPGKNLSGPAIPGSGMEAMGDM